MRDFSQKQLGTRVDTNSAEAGTTGVNLTCCDDGSARVRAMAPRDYYDQTATSIATLGRNELKRQIRGFRGRFKLDFTEDYLDSLSVDRLRHILLAALVNAKRHN
jgi:hypothetical protein